MNRSKYIFFLFIFLLGFLSCKTATESIPQSAESITQLAIPRVDEMPNMPAPYMMKDWKKTALEFDKYVYNFDEKGPFMPMIWMDTMKRNFPQNTYGLYTALGDVREGPNVNDGENHEAIGALGSIIGASLVGIDKSNQDGHNYVAMVKNFLNKDNGWNIIMNFTSKKAHIGGGYGNDYWYDIFNNVLFYGVANYYPKEPGYDEIMRTIADQFLASATALGSNYSYSFFDFKTMKGGTNHIPTQEDVAAGYAFVLYSAYVKYNDVKYLKGAEMALQALQGQKENRNYELFMPFGAYIGARLNAEQGTDYDVMKFLNWTFEGKSVNRDGWGVIVGNWGNYDVSGIYGSTKDKGGYGFAMNTFDLAWPLLPMVRYDQRYSRTIGKWALNAANAARLFYPYDIPDSLQALPDRKGITKNVIAYEGLVKEPNLPGHIGKSPFAQGDGPLWAPGMPQETMFSIYGSGHAGIFGGTIHTTDVEGVLMLDCIATDMFQKNASYPTYIVYNPYKEKKSVSVPVGSSKVDIYDAVSQKIINRNVSGDVKIDIAADEAPLLVFIPAGAKVIAKEGKLYAGDKIIDFRFKEKK
ncbi:hypothetical protein [Candidatus Brachybacter algidus]|jgi:hypothetical protein|uniref:hypothetical protein n=2 Tax=Candidatus Brachybacter algidus TaxID=2982024 RepID=UPI001B7530D0|nr:hypothetical protein [Candidatus Brachybacter algidus]MBP7538893.1 hypothetical protein [Saprospiraceae bacterium]MBP8891836.1 hypothetical protein [Saprospiraceae bacterium]MBP9125706.1 hypothetical protein [Saprospiraceae bacterium]MBP9845694.1 hypothetical protein [Saprospiraceae bacterium]